MAGWNGAGTFSRTHDWTEDQGNGILIRADRHDDNDVDFVNGINNCMTKDGQNAATADLDMGSNKLTMGAAGTAVTDFPIVSQVQNSSTEYAASTGSADAYILALSPAPAAYVAGQVFSFKANFASTGAATLDVNSLGAKTIKKLGDSTDLTTNDIVTDQIVVVEYDGTQFQMMFNPEDTAAALVTLGAGTVTSVASGDGLTGGPITSTGTLAVDVNSLTDVAITATDEVLYGDVSDSNNIRKDTVQGILDLVTSISAATQAEQEAGSSTSVYTSPGRQHFHPSAAKCRGQITLSGATPTLTSDYNITSISDDGVGDYGVTIGTNFANGNYSIVHGIDWESSGQVTASSWTGKAAGSFSIKTFVPSTANTRDISNDFACFGDQ